jgi:hypothetical protein
MLTLSDHITEYKDSTNDDDKNVESRALRRINQAHRFICGMKDWHWLEEEFTILSVASQQSYYLPLAMRKLKSVSVVANNIRYVPKEIIDPDSWRRLNVFSTSNISDGVQFFYQETNRIYFWPTFSTGGNTISILGLKEPVRDMTILDYSTGTIAVTNNSATITGTGTNWTAGVNPTVLPGSYIIINGQEYEISAVNSTTSLTLLQPYQGVTASGLTYKIGDGTLVPDAFDDAIWLRADMDFYRNRESTKQKQSVMEDFEDIISRMTTAEYSKSTSNVTPRGTYRLVNPNDYPRNIG